MKKSAKKTNKNTNQLKHHKVLSLTDKTPKNTDGNKDCCVKSWNLVPLRFALGLMFLSAGLPKLFSLIAGGSQIPGFFAGLGIPIPVFSAWVVALVEVVGGIFLLLGFMTWWTGVFLGIVMIVATLLTAVSPFNWIKLTQHLVFIAALISLMWGEKNFKVINRDYCSCMKCCRK